MIISLLSEKFIVEKKVALVGKAVTNSADSSFLTFQRVFRQTIQKLWAVRRPRLAETSSSRDHRSSPLPFMSLLNVPAPSNHRAVSRLTTCLAAALLATGSNLRAQSPTPTGGAPALEATTTSLAAPGWLLRLQAARQHRERAAAWPAWFQAARIWDQDADFLTLPAAVAPRLLDPPFDDARSAQAAGDDAVSFLRLVADTPLPANATPSGSGLAWNAAPTASAHPATATALVGPQPRTTGQVLEVSSVDPNDGFTYYGSAAYTVPTATTTYYDEVDAGIGNNGNNGGTIANGTGTITQTGGTLSLTAGSASKGTLFLGVYGGDTGTYNQSGGSLQAVTEYIGYGGTGTYNQTGGNNIVGAGGLFVGNTFYSVNNAVTNGTGLYTLANGTISAALTAPNESVGYYGSGTFTQNSGMNTIAAGGTLSLGYKAAGIYNLNGGTLSTPSVSMVTTANGNNAAGRGTFNFNGGVLQATVATTTLLSGLTTVNVQAGGAKIDTNGFAVTIPQALLHNATGTDGGLTKQTGAGTLILSGANTYIGPTVVNAGTLQAGVVSVAGSSGAFGVNSAVTLANTSGVALALNGFNTQIGSLTGGGGTGGNVTLGGATLTVGADNTSPTTPFYGVISGSGGLTKIGAGTLTLSGTNTYTGTTTVSAGTLAINGTNNGLGTVNVTGGTLLVNGTLNNVGVNVQNYNSTLSGNGTISGQVNMTNSAVLSPGSNAGGVGKLSLGALSLMAVAPTFDIGAGTFYDQVVGNSFIALNTDSVLTLNVNSSATAYSVGQVLDLFHSPTFSGTFSNFANNGLYTYGVDTFQANYTGTDFTLTVTSVPEPGTWTGGALLLGAAALRLRPPPAPGIVPACGDLLASAHCLFDSVPEKQFAFDSSRTPSRERVLKARRTNQRAKRVFAVDLCDAGSRYSVAKLTFPPNEGDKKLHPLLTNRTFTFGGSTS